ncbi:trigger factor [Patescibacteria group bacterium]|nr:MAG: trigger factor [Patescibacteria group bacterium]
MQHTLKQLEKAQVEFEITVPTDDYRADMEAAAIRISERTAIHGFRPGKAPYDLVKQQVGEIRILEEAMQSIVEKNFFAAVKTENLETIGMPQITLQKFAPGNDLIFKAVVALFPKIKLGDLKKIKIKKQTKEVSEAQVNEVLENLKKMQGKEALKNDAAAKEDKVVVNMEMFLDKVPVEGGHAQNHAVYLAEPHYIPGLAEQLVGLKKDDTKEFALKFPEAHYQKHLAGKNIDFKIKINDVFELQYPLIDESFAKALGQESLDKLKGILKENLAKEAEQKEDQRLEIEMFDKLIEASEFGDIPEVLLNAEKNKMFHELKHALEHQGITMEKYLADLKKTEQEIHNDFAEQAAKRVKAALISREVAKEQNIGASKEDIEKEIELIKNSYKDDRNVEENLKKPEVINTIAITIGNRKVVQWLKEKVLN